MSCDLVQRRLLALENPGRPPAEMQAHLAGCAACRAWQRRLVEMERRVRQLPVPSSAGRDAFVGRLVAGSRTPPGGLRAARRERVLRKVALATALAAGLAMFAVGFGALHWPADQVTTAPRLHADPFLARLLRHDLSLAKSTDAGRRLENLTGLAEALSDQAAPLARADAADDLGALARLYERVLEDGVGHVLRQGPAVGVGERGRAADRLAAEARHADALAVGLAGPSAESVQAMAAAARKAEADLRGVARRPAPRPAWCLAAAAPAVRRCLLAPAAVVLAAVVTPPPAPADAEVRHFRRDRALIQQLVQDGLDLARENDPVKRADRCNDIAEGLARALASAAGDGEGDRVAELGHHLRDVLQEGVAHNLRTARAGIPAGSAEEKKLEKVSGETKEVVFGLKTKLDDGRQPRDSADVQAALRALDDGWKVVQQALRPPAATP